MYTLYMNNILRCMKTSSIAMCALLVGCGSEVTNGGSGTNSPTGGTASDVWTTLVDGTWQMTAGKEGYWCTRKTVAEDTYIKAFRAQAPVGTHHTLLLVTEGGIPDGQEDCGPTLGANMIFASGLGTGDFEFPEGVAVKVPAGSQLLLNLHLFNTGSETLEGISGTMVKTIAAADMKHEAEMILGGPSNIQIPPNGTQTVEGSCIFPGDTTVFSVWAHMHKYGTNMKITHVGASGNKVLHDGPYSFEEQINYLIDPLPVKAGEEMLIECKYQNTTSQTIYFGDSSNAEMCFGGFYRYPKLGKGCF